MVQTPPLPKTTGTPLTLHTRVCFGTGKFIPLKHRCPPGCALRVHTSFLIVFWVPALVFYGVILAACPQLVGGSQALYRQSNGHLQSSTQSFCQFSVLFISEMQCVYTAGLAIVPVNSMKNVEVSDPPKNWAHGTTGAKNSFHRRLKKMLN